MKRDPFKLFSSDFSIT